MEAGLGVVKHTVSDEAHEWMEEQLAAWQRENNAGPGDKPIPNRWYWDKRIECIGLGLDVTVEHSWDVVRSWLTGVANKQAPPAAKKPAKKQIRSYDVD